MTAFISDVTDTDCKAQCYSFNFVWSHNWTVRFCFMIQLGGTVLFYHTTEWYNCLSSFSDWDSSLRAIVLFDHTTGYNSFVLSYNWMVQLCSIVQWLGYYFVWSYNWVQQFRFIIQVNGTIVFYRSVIGILFCLIIQLGTTASFYHTTEGYNCVLSFSDWDSTSNYFVWLCNWVQQLRFIIQLKGTIVFYRSVIGIVPAIILFDHAIELYYLFPPVFVLVVLIVLLTCLQLFHQ